MSGGQGRSLRVRSSSKSAEPVGDVGAGASTSSQTVLKDATATVDAVSGGTTIAESDGANPLAAAPPSLDAPVVKLVSGGAESGAPVSDDSAKTDASKKGEAKAPNPLAPPKTAASVILRTVAVVGERQDASNAFLSAQMAELLSQLKDVKVTLSAMSDRVTALERTNVDARMLAAAALTDALPEMQERVRTELEKQAAALAGTKAKELVQLEEVAAEAKTTSAATAAALATLTADLASHEVKQGEKVAELRNTVVTAQTKVHAANAAAVAESREISAGVVKALAITDATVAANGAAVAL